MNAWGWILATFALLALMGWLCARLWLDDMKLGQYNKGLIMGKAAAEVTNEEQQRILREAGIDPDTLPEKL